MPEPPDFDSLAPVRTVRLRARRLARWRGVHARRDHFPQGDVYRVWFGWWLVTLMAPSRAQRIG